MQILLLSFFFVFISVYKSFFPLELLLCSFYPPLSLSSSPKQNIFFQKTQQSTSFQFCQFADYKWFYETERVYLKTQNYFARYAKPIASLNVIHFFEIMTTLLLLHIAIFLLSNEGFLPANLKYKFNQRLQKCQVDSLRYI